MAEAVPIVCTILASINTILAGITAVGTLGRENQRLQGRIKGIFGRLESEVRMAEWDMAKYEGVDEKLTMEMQELLCDIDDFTSDLSIPGKTEGFFNSLKAMDSRPQEIELIDSFLAGIKSITDRQNQICKQVSPPTDIPSAEAAPSYAHEKDLDEGFPQTMTKFLELLSPAHGGQLKLISIVGCRGLGKTALARAVYEDTVVQLSPPQTEIHTANPGPPSPTKTEIDEPIVATETTPVRPSPSTIEIHEANFVTANETTPVQPSPPTIKSHIPIATNEENPVHPSQATTDNYEPITANGATPVQPSPPTIRNHIHVSTNEDNHVHPSQATTENHEPITANGAAPIQPSPPTTKNHIPVATNEDNPVHPSQATTENHEPITANAATPVQPSPPTTKNHIPVATNEDNHVHPSQATTENHEPVTANAATPVQPSPPTTKNHIPVATNEDNHVHPSQATTENHEPVTANAATPVQPSPPTTKNHIPVATNEDNHVHPSQATTKNHEPITANGASPVQSPRPAMAVYESTSMRFHRANKTIHVPPSPHKTEIQEVVAANNGTPVQTSPATSQMFEPVAFNCKAWVEASACKDVKDLLNKVLNTLHPRPAARKDTSQDIKNFLQDKRYLVIIDDLRSCGVQWKDIEHVFPKNNKDSRIIVTTCFHSVARDYSSGCYYVYGMECLGEANSEGLFLKKFFGSRSHRPLSAPERTCSTSILAKCGGLPLAVISSGNYLCWKDRNPYLSYDRYEEVCEELYNILASDKTAFADMKRMFAQCYKDLTDYDHKNCLLYLSIFPRGHQINSKSFVRKLKGEALVAGDVLKCLKELIDRSMIEHPLTRNSCSVAKWCQVQRMMLEFTIHKSVSRNLVTVVERGIVRHNKHDGQDKRHKKVRRLTVQSGSRNEEGSSSSSVWGLTVQSGSSCEDGSSSTSVQSDLIPAGIELSAVRSLTIFQSELLHPMQNIKEKSKLLPNSRVNFKSCKMMRVLDLEGCKGLKCSNTAIDDICELLFLKYLSLKNTDVDKLPTKVQNLKLLETLDITKTWVSILPVEVIMLPALSHLLGEFELPQFNGRETEALTFLKEKSKLHTLAGIVIHDTQGFKVVIEHASKLKKVKIYDKKHTSPASSTPASKKKSLFRAILPNRKDKQPSHPKVVADRRLVGVLVSSLRKRFLDLDSISIDSSGISKAFLASDHKAHSVISSIKLRGPLTSMSGRTLKGLSNLKKLHLFSTGLSSQKLVEALQILDSLKYLKLAEEDHKGSWEGDFCVQSGGFPALRELCFEGPKKYPRLKIAQAAMSILASLHLLCSPLTGVEETIENRQSPGDLMRVEGIEHLKLLDEVILHHTADDATIKVWKEAAKKHTNMPSVRKQADRPSSNEA